MRLNQRSKNLTPFSSSSSRILPCNMFLSPSLLVNPSLGFYSFLLLPTQIFFMSSPLLLKPSYFLFFSPSTLFFLPSPLLFKLSLSSLILFPLPSFLFLSEPFTFEFTLYLSVAVCKVLNTLIDCCLKFRSRKRTCLIG